jgi:pimeloyl-ACP methyl ester carboxylesterase
MRPETPSRVSLMAFADVNGQRLYFEDSGGDGPAIVFSHGFAMDHEMFAPQVDVLRDRWRCITWDERAHGATETTPDPFTYWDSASDLLGLLDHLGIERAVLAGMSQGGYLSLRAALTAPDRVRALVLIDTQAAVEDPEKVGGYDQLIDLWTGPDGPPQEVLDLVAAVILGDGWEGTPEWQAKWRKIPAQNIRQAYETLTTRENDVADRLSELSVPTLVIHGDQDAAIDVPSAEAMAKALNGEIVLVPGGGHAANLTHPAESNAALVRFLDGLSPE